MTPLERGSPYTLCTLSAYGVISSWLIPLLCFLFFKTDFIQIGNRRIKNKGESEKFVLMRLVL